MSTEKPRYFAEVDAIYDKIAEACNQLGKGDEGCLSRGSVSMGEALERAKRLRYQLRDDHSAAQEQTRSDKEGGE